MVYPLLRLLSRLISLLSWRQAQALGAFLGLVWFHVVRIRRKVVLDNLQRALGCQGREGRRLAREVYRHLAMSAMEFLRVPGLTAEEVRALVRVEGYEHYLAARSQGRGVLVLTAHLGNWDLLSCSQAILGRPVAVVTKGMTNRGFERFWMGTRQGAGVRLIREPGVIEGVLEALRRDEVVGFILDQHMPGRHAVRVDFFGHPAATSPVLVHMARASGAPVLPVFMERLKDGGHLIRVLPPMGLAEGGSWRETVRINTERFSRVIEEAIGRCPEQWLWLHRRWKAQHGRREG